MPDNAIKFADGSDDIVEGFAIPYGGPFAGKDFHGQYFDAETDFVLEWIDPHPRPVFYDHGLDGEVKLVKIGEVPTYEIKDKGVWAQAQLDKNSEWYTVVHDLVEKGALGFSSGSVGHHVRVDGKSGHIKQWPWLELSLTPTPANPYAVAAPALKSRWTDAGVDVPAAVLAVKLNEFNSNNTSTTAAVPTVTYYIGDANTATSTWNWYPEALKTLTPQALHDAAIASGAKCAAEVIEPAPVLALKVGEIAVTMADADLEALRETASVAAIKAVRDRFGL